MSGPIKELNEHFARAKNYYGRLARGYNPEDLLRCLASVGHGLKLMASGVIVGAPRQSADTVVRALVQRLNKISDLRCYAPQGLSYDPAAVKALLVQVVTVARQLKEKECRESLEGMRARKLQIDKHLGRGGKLLMSKPAEADKEFAAAADLYVDEHLLFRIVAQKYAMVERWDKVAKYAERAMAVTPDDEQTFVLAMQAFEQVGDEEKLMAAMHGYYGRFAQPDAKGLLKMATLYKQFGRDVEAKEAARKVLAMDPANIKARRIVTGM
ncbi:MAG: hypothetical protein H0S85_16215 [Desulfovibrionaceae bacterium]|jgi:tetratricopeptide (TPR) repeat protein|nr:hypothetical protein [Desulfovibrionaceae bacterium]